MRTSWLEHRWPGVLTLISALLVIVSMKFTWPDGDDGRYAVWAIALARGEGITNIHLPEPSPETVVPPGLSIALAPWISLLGTDNLKAMMVFSPMLLVVLVRVFAGWMRRTFPAEPWTGIAITVIGLWGVFTISAAWRVHTEILYMLLSVASMATWPTRQQGAGRAALAGLLAGAAFITRTVGLALLPAGIVALLWRREFKKAFAFGAAFIAINAPLTYRTMTLAGTPVGYSQSSGLDGLADLIRNLSVFIPHYWFYGLPDLMFYRLVGADGLLAMTGLGFLGLAVAVIIGLIILAGYLLQLRPWHYPALYLGAYFVLIGAFNQSDYAARGEFLFQDRYVIPILPLAAMYLFYGLDGCGRFLTGSRFRPVRLLLPAAAVYIAVTATGAAMSRFARERPVMAEHPMSPARFTRSDNLNERAWGAYFACARFAREATPAGAIMVCRKPHDLFLGSGRRAIRYLELGAGASLLADMDRLRSLGEVYLLEDAFPPDTAFGRERIENVVPLLQQYSHRFELVFETTEPVARLWRLLPGS